MKPMHINTEDCGTAVPLIDEQPLSSGDEDDGDYYNRRRPHHHGGSSEKAASRRLTPKDWSKSLFCLTYLNLLLFLVSVLVLIKSHLLGSVCTCAATPPPPPPNEALRYTSSWSPVFDEVDLAPRPATVDGSLYTSPEGGAGGSGRSSSSSSSNASVYRGEPSAETDAAWDDLAAEAYEVILVNASTMRRAGYNPDHYFKAPVSWKSRVASMSSSSSSSSSSSTTTAESAAESDEDQDLFPVQIDVFHQIHCLNALRKQMHYSHYFAAKFPDGHPDDMHRMHMRHCLHMVLQSLTCSADVDIVPHRWVEADDAPFAQFSITKKCRDFDALRAWNRRNAVADVREVWPRSKEGSMPADAFVWPGHGESGEVDG